MPGQRPTSIQLHHARVLLTGASSGIGRSLALALAATSARLAVTARRVSRLEQLSGAIVAAGGHAPVLLPADLAVPGSPARLASEAVDALGGLDLLINVAGAAAVGAADALGDGPAARSAFETNFWAPLALVGAVVPTMKRAGGGCIVNVTSTIQAVPIPLLGYYGASKSALSVATQSMRHELRGSGIRVVEVVPGSTDTALRDVDALPWRAAPPRTPRPAAPEAVAEAIVNGLRRGDSRIVFPRHGAAALEVPAIGRLVARMAARRLG